MYSILIPLAKMSFVHDIQSEIDYIHQSGVKVPYYINFIVKISGTT
jgi:hypothetical protein